VVLCSLFCPIKDSSKASAIAGTNSKVAEASRLCLPLEDKDTAAGRRSHSGTPVSKVAEASRLCSPSPFSFYNKEIETTKIRGAYLPHWNQYSVIYFVTFRLADSLPQEKLKILSEEKKIWIERNPEPHNAEQKSQFHQRFTERLQQWLDCEYGSMILRNVNARKIVSGAINHFNGTRYHLDEYVVAANHVHALMAPRERHTLSGILHSWKSFTSKKLLDLPIAATLKTAPVVWQKERWDHIVRSERSLEKFREYIRAHSNWGG
jgi:REP element-mobilizing transposase RayT